MRFLVVMDPIDGVDVDRDTTFGFLLAAQRRGHACFMCAAEDLYREADGRPMARARSLEVRHVRGDHFTAGPEDDIALGDFDSVWMRKDPPFHRDYLYATYILELAERETVVVNRPRGLRDANEKLYALHFPDLIPGTRITRDPRRILQWVQGSDAPLVVKPVDGHGGKGVFVLDRSDRNVPSIVETLTQEGREWVVVQQYLPAAREGDKRIILIDGEPRGAILRVPQGSDHRGNIHVGGQVIATDLSERDRAICAAVGPRLRQDGLWFVGLDVIGGLLTEVNVTSPTGIREIHDLGGPDLGDAFVEFVEARVRG